jgi:exodeoxyribonuclease V alpha subunit
MLNTLNQAVSRDALRQVDVQFARHILVLSAGEDPDLLLAAALVSHRVGQGDVCLPLDGCADLPLFREAPPETVISAPEPGTWADALLGSGVVGRPGDRAPLILDDQRRLYLARYWHFEQRLAGHLQARVGAWCPDVDRDQLREGLDRLFPKTSESKETDWQRFAAALAVLRPLCVISGGPGTGKTRTVTSILALLLAQAGKRPLRIELAAPTGKAAARMSESIARQKKDKKFPLEVTEAIRRQIPEETQTLHRLLGFRPGRANPRHGPDDPLHLDVLVIDEASMVDLSLMARTLDALPAGARLILLGDRNQLASVEAGMVMGDICGRGTSLSFGEETRAVLQDVGCDLAGTDFESAEYSGGLADHVVELKKIWRTDADSGIRPLAKAINDGRGMEGVAILQDSRYPDVELLEQSRERLEAYVRDQVVHEYREVIDAPDAGAALKALGRFRILCAVREGIYGVGALNSMVALELEAAGLIHPEGAIYAGRPVMIRTNDHAQHLYNGDVGLIRPDPDAGGALRVFFETAKGPRRILPARLPPHETVYAMTVHKSQGSEFDHVLLVLPETESRIATRELLYTGITRASKKVTVLAQPERLQEAAARKVERSTGLRDALWR